jgi:hypothetical protein
MPAFCLQVSGVAGLESFARALSDPPFSCELPGSATYASLGYKRPANNQEAGQEEADGEEGGVDAVGTVSLSVCGGSPKKVVPNKVPKTKAGQCPRTPPKPGAEEGGTAMSPNGVDPESSSK